MLMKWIDKNDYLRGYKKKLEELPAKVRIAAFDLDDTLTYRSNGTEPTDELLPNKINKLIKNKYLIIIFTNQSGMSSNNFDMEQWKANVETLISTLITRKKFYYSIYAAKKFDWYRKPNIELWEQMKRDLTETYGHIVTISKKSFFVGDAAGRIKPDFYKKLKTPKTKTGDFSDSDRKFAINIGINFMTPETFILDLPETPYKLRGIDPEKILASASKCDYDFIPRLKEMVITVGAPGSGKTSFIYKYYLASTYASRIIKYGYISKDDSSSVQDHNIKYYLENGHSFVVDGTNPSIENRKFYISLARSYGYKRIRCIIFNTDIDLAKHLNNFRHITTGTPRVPDVVYNIYKKKYVKPSKKEHFDIIEEIDFKFSSTSTACRNDKHRKIFLQLT